MTSNLELTLATMAVGEAKAALRRRAEEELGPYLIRIREAAEQRIVLGGSVAMLSSEHTQALEAALDKALELLGVQR